MDRTKFWNSLKENCPQREIGYVIHTVNCSKARAVGMTPMEMMADIKTNGLFAPENYSIVTLKMGCDWISHEGNEAIDLVFHTETKPTEEGEDVIRNSAASGFPLRDLVSFVELDAVPLNVRRIFPLTERFVRIPPGDLVAIFRWDMEIRKDIVGKIRKIALNVVTDVIRDDEGVKQTIELFREVQTQFINGAKSEEVIGGIALNSFNVQRRRDKYLKALKAFI